MSRVKPTVNFIHAWRHPDEIADEVEAELRFHVQMRTQANIEKGMTPDEANLRPGKASATSTRSKSVVVKSSEASLRFEAFKNGIVHCHCVSRGWRFTVGGQHAAP